ncbi:MATE family efflux transporter [uncultured Desulfobacter sp.]|uniref:MATE family efflux transporter n=1 Tax=uncultured Desulfobacter sp. TaxID=240139 RepID=UPI002AA66B89|nr:MATE family efflux transporter [uncultured Desulfobacter sp.]
MNQDRELALTQPMGKLFLRMAIPGIIGTVVMGLYNFVDAIFLGQFVGPAAVGAVGLLYVLVIMNQAILVIMGSGSGAVLSVAMGQKDHETVGRLLGNLIPITFLASTAFALCLYLCAPGVVKFLGGNGALLQMAVAYLRILVFGMPFMATGAAMNMLLRGEGKMRTAMMIASGSFLLNIALDPILIAWAGWGIKGAAWATVIAQIVYFLWQILFHWFGETQLRLVPEKITISTRLTTRVMKSGTPAMLMQLMSVIQMGVLYKVLAHAGGTDHLALMTSGMRCYMLVFFIIFGIAYGMQPVVGMNFGAGNYGRVLLAWKYFTAVSVLITLGFWILFMTYTHLIVSWFISDPALAQMGVPYFRILNFPLPFMGAIPTTMMFFIAIERPKPAGKLAIARQVVLFVPLVMLFYYLMQVKGVWLSMPVTDVLTALMGLLMILKEFVKLSKAKSPANFENKAQAP